MAEREDVGSRRARSARRRIAVAAVFVPVLAGSLLVGDRGRPYGPRALALSVFVVDSTTDEGDLLRGDAACQTAAGTCTLRAAIEEANALPGHDRIEFDVPGSGPHRFLPQSRYPLIVDPAGVTIDGYSQPGSSVNTMADGSNAVLRIEVRGTGPNRIDGFDFRSGGNVIRGFAIFDFRRHIRFWGSAASGNEVVGNFIGTDAAGTFEQGVRTIASTGVQLERGASDNRIGRAGDQHRNVISGSGDRGVATFNDGTDRNLVQNNVIGLAPDGTSRLRNWGHGVDVNYNSSFTLIGGAGVGEGNVISGNQLSGVEISHVVGSSDSEVTQGNEVVDNLIGTNARGDAAPPDLRNREHGVNLEGKGACPITCTPDIRRNRVAGNVIVGGQANVMIWKGAFDNEVVDNVIGVLADGSPAASSSSTIWGVLIEAGAFDNRVERNQVAGVATGVAIRPDNNYPASNHGATFPTFGNTVTLNEFRGVGPGLAIDLWPVGAVNVGGNPTPANVQHGVALPTITRADTDAVTVSACAGCVVELFVADECALTGCPASGAGRHALGAAMAGLSGAATFTFRVDPADPHVVVVGEAVTATATAAAGSSSEFSRRVDVAQGLIGFSVSSPPTTTTTTIVAPTPGAPSPNGVASPSKPAHRCRVGGC